MPRATHPHTPDADLAAHRAHAAEAGAPDILTPDIAAFCLSGVSVIIAFGRKDATPAAGMGCGCRMLGDGRLRLLLLKSGNRPLVEAAERGDPVAATFSQPVNHRSIQIKGTNPRLAAPTEEDRQEALRQMAGLREVLREIEYSSRFTDAFCHVDTNDLIAIDLDPDAAFAQTPGPGAGAELKP